MYMYKGGARRRLYERQEMQSMVLISDAWVDSMFGDTGALIPRGYSAKTWKYTEKHARNVKRAVPAGCLDPSKPQLRHHPGPGKKAFRGN
jgi:hypothetical protein